MMHRSSLMALAVALIPSPAFAQASPSAFTNATRYDLSGRVVGTITADPDTVGSGNPFIATRNTYDGAGRMVTVETGILGSWQSEAVLPVNWGSAFTPQQTVESAYDAGGRKLRETTREGGTSGTIRAVTQYSYNVDGRLQCTAIRMNAADFASPPASACTQGTGGADRITSTVYDVAGQRIQLREGVGTAIEAAEATWAYSANGQITTVIDANGNRAELRYDRYDRQDRWTFPSTTRPSSYNDATQTTALATAGSVNSADYEEYSYDSNGNRTNLRKRDARNIAYAYDALNRVTQKTYPDGGATAVYYSYDLRNLQLSARFTSQSGDGIVNSYDGFGRLLGSANSTGGTTRTLSYLHDRNGNRTRITHPDSQYFDTYYDGLNRPASLSDSSSWRVLYAYHGHGALYAMQRLNGVTNYRNYDGLQRLYSTELYYPTAYNASDSISVYGYNAANQINSYYRTNDTYAWTSHYAVQRAYTTNGLNQYTAAGGASFTYDANGNLTSDGTRTFAYDIENRLVSETSGGVALNYDPLGRLFQVSSTAGPTRQFLYDGDALVAEYEAGTMTRRYVHNVGADVPMLSYQGTGLTQVSYLHTNHQGSIIALSNASGAAATINRYDEYGIPAATNAGRFQYTGQIWLDEIGMYHYKARIYSPTLGRFLQTDPIGYEGGVNLYAYVNDDPINEVDPSGNNPLALVIPILVGAGRACVTNSTCRSGGAAIVGGVVRSIIPTIPRADRPIAPAWIGGVVDILRQEARNEEARDRRRRSAPSNRPSGTRPIDRWGLGSQDIHDIKAGIGAGPRDWVGIAPDGTITTTNPENGEAEDRGNVSDHGVDIEKSQESESNRNRRRGNRQE